MTRRGPIISKPSGTEACGRVAGTQNPRKRAPSEGLERFARCSPCACACAGMRDANYTITLPTFPPFQRIEKYSLISDAYRFLGDGMVGSNGSGCRKGCRAGAKKRQKTADDEQLTNSLNSYAVIQSDHTIIRNQLIDAADGMLGRTVRLFVNCSSP